MKEELRYSTPNIFDSYKSTVHKMAVVFRWPLLVYIHVDLLQEVEILSSGNDKLCVSVTCSSQI